MTMMMNAINYTPSHPDQFQIEWGPEGTYASRLISLESFAPDSILATLGPETILTETKAYTSIQFKEETPTDRLIHLELNSDLVYINHSCEPNVSFVLENGIVGRDQHQWVLKSLCEIKKGQPLTFAYFSTEWEMTQPFDCQCQSKKCLGRIEGAKFMDESILSKYFINDHIKRMKKSQK
ncbi:uncharacterized protein MELLADRAFT_87258 [Melampsora larici-populina 98AG31]|uniref:SET domain-containing protein n=1 Tax=Melampsora larici-populina (strain 98AG31 / pathotype 3-4-7) TaxID=747676 RepID=F4SDS3_MELLP|nr:uncharacterized protein MELLADRAFT_87258 [Melampsora larici-populina 98AG31]EGF97205.1 hypothetical protein MELLADRAFT_87258 [Melampsora larici-populina 98AG31]